MLDTDGHLIHIGMLIVFFGCVTQMNASASYVNIGIKYRVKAQVLPLERNASA